MREPIPDHVRKLLEYYIECARQDEVQPVRAFLDDVGKRFIPWPFASDLWCPNTAEPTVHLARQDQRRFVDELIKTPRGGSILYGYPTYIEVTQQGRRQAIPLFTCPIEYELYGRELRLHVTPEWPQMNPEHLKKFASTAEKQREVLDTLGLLDTKDDPPDGLIFDILERMEEMGLLQDVLEPLDPEELSQPRVINEQGFINQAALFASEKPRYTAGLIRDLEEMVQHGSPGWENTALGTMLGAHKGTDDEEQTVVQVVPLNHEQRQAVQKAISSPLTAVTGPPGTGKSQIVISLVADAYIHGRRVLFTSKNNKAVEVVEDRVNALAENPLMIRTGSFVGKSKRNLRHELAQRLIAMLALRPPQDGQHKYEELKARYEELQNQEDGLWKELETIRHAYSRLLSLDEAQAIFSRDYTAEEWEALRATKDLPDSDRLTAALQLADKHIDRPNSRRAEFLRRLSVSRDRKRIQHVAEESIAECPLLGTYQTGGQSFQAWRTWLVRALSVTEALGAISEYRNALKELNELRPRDEVARQLRRVRTNVTDSGSKLVNLFAQLAPDRLEAKDRRAIGNFRSLQERLAGDQLGGREYGTLRRHMARLFHDISRHITAWCVTNLSARNSLPLEPNLFDLLIIDEASQCDIASALPLLYRSKRAVIIGDPQQLRHIAEIEQFRDQQLQADYGLGVDNQIFTYSQNSLFDLTISQGAIGEPILLHGHYRSHSHIVGFSNREWYQDSLRLRTDYATLKTPPDGAFGIRWTDIRGTALRFRGGSVFIPQEVEAVVEQATDLLMNQKFDGSVGVVTPFRPQADMIWRRIAQRVPPDVINQAQFIVDTAHGFQGDERDIVLCSPCVSSDLPSGAYRFLRDNENLFNVAITRARSLMHVIGSQEACASSGIPHVERFASYCAQIERAGSSPYETYLASDERIGPWEKPLYEALVAKGLNPLPQHPVNQYRLDLAIISEEIRIDVEADGKSTHLDALIDAERDALLENLGWRVVRFWNHQIRDDIDYCVKTVLNLLPKP